MPTLKTDPRIPLEKDIQRAVIQYLAFRGFHVWRNQTQGTWDAKKGIYRNNQTLKGVPDLLGILPKGRFFGIEIKRPGRHLDLHQLRFHQLANISGAFCVCVHSVAEMEAALTAEGYIAPKERAWPSNS